MRMFMHNLSRILATAAVAVILILAIVGSVVFATPHNEGPWIDTTDVVAEEGANAVGRQATDPLINTDQGNMLVFFFTLAGIAGGLTIGYYWRKLMIEKDVEV
jgi:cobalt/nickel transport protein